MSLKNANDLSEFGSRLRNLLAEKNLSPKTLAKDLLENGLVHVKSRGKDPWTKDNNAIGAVEKKIRAHIKAADANCLQGEFVIAYCKYFDISSDYLFGITKIRTSDMELRRVCEITGLTENAVKRLAYDGGDPRRWQWNSLCWSRLITSNVYNSIDRTIQSIQDQQMEKAKAEAYIDALKTKMNGRGGRELRDMQLDLQGYENQVVASDNAISGSLFLISRDVSNVIEMSYVAPTAKLKSAYKQRAEEEINDIYG